MDNENLVIINLDEGGEETRVEISMDYLLQMQIILAQVSTLRELVLNYTGDAEVIKVLCKNYLDQVEFFHNQVEADTTEVRLAKEHIDNIEQELLALKELCEGYKNETATNTSRVTELYNEVVRLSGTVSEEAGSALEYLAEARTLAEQVRTNAGAVQEARNWMEWAKQDINRIGAEATSAKEASESVLQEVSRLHDDSVSAAQFVQSESDKISSAFTQAEALKNEAKEAADRAEASMANKQDKLIAGDNVTIEGNTISATGGAKIYVGTDTPDGFEIYIEPQEIIDEPIEPDEPAPNEPLVVECTMSEEWSGSAWSDEAGGVVTGTVRYTVDGNSVEVVAENFTLKVGSVLSPANADVDYSAPIVLESLPLPNGVAEGVVSYERSYGSGIEPYVYVTPDGQLKLGFYKLGYGAIVSPFNATFTYTKR